MKYILVSIRYGPFLYYEGGKAKNKSPHHKTMSGQNDEMSGEKFRCVVTICPVKLLMFCKLLIILSSGVALYSEWLIDFLLSYW